MPFRLPLKMLQDLAETFLPDMATVQRYTETSTSDGVGQAWTDLASGVPCRVSPRGTRAEEGLGAGGAVVRAISPWIVTLPAYTDVTERDRIVVTGSDRTDGRTFECQRIDQRSYESQRLCECELLT
jgi:hypothetical protein